MLWHIWKRLLSSFSWSKRSTGPRFKVILYTRHGCHLCEDAWTFLQTWKKRYGYSLQEIDIDHANLVQEYGERIPVISVNGKVRFYGRINSILFHRLMRQQTKKPG